MKNLSALILTLTITFSLTNLDCNSQRLYKNRKRVKVTPSESVTQIQQPGLISISEELKSEPLNLEISSNAQEPEIIPGIHEEQIDPVKSMGMNSQSAFRNVDEKLQYFIAKFKARQSDRLKKADEIEDVQLARWLKIMIILYAAGFIFLILAIIFGVLPSTWPAALICWVLFGVLWIAATIVLILGLTGVMS